MKGGGESRRPARCPDAERAAAGPPVASPPVLGHRVLGREAAGARPVVLLNGGLMSYAAWEPIARGLAQRRRVVLADFRGQMFSPGEAPRDLATHGADVAALLDHLQIARAHLVGASFGAEVAVVLAARCPERVASLAAITAGERTSEALARGSREMAAAATAILAGADRGGLMDLILDGLYAPDWVRAHRDEVARRRRQLDLLPLSWFAGLAGILAAAGDFDLRPVLARVRCPALVVVAAGDRVFPPARGRALARGLGARLVEHPAAGHALVAEDPEWLAAVVGDFLDEGEARVQGGDDAPAG